MRALACLSDALDRCSPRPRLRASQSANWHRCRRQPTMRPPVMKVPLCNRHRNESRVQSRKLPPRQSPQRQQKRLPLIPITRRRVQQLYAAAATRATRSNRRMATIPLCNQRQHRLSRSLRLPPTRRLVPTLTIPCIHFGSSLTPIAFCEHV